MITALMFPGQGSQFVGMGQDLAQNFPVARHVFSEVDDAIDQRLSRMMFEGPLDELTATRNAQPALMAVSLAVMRILAVEGGLEIADVGQYAAGHSLGEYTALTAAGAFSVARAAQLLRLRGEAMQAAVPQGQGGMAALIGGSLEQAVSLAAMAAKGEVCTVANDNSTEQQVLSGHKGAIDRAVALASEYGFKRALLLPVSAPFHCALMQPAAAVMADALADVIFSPLSVPVIANTSAQLEKDPAAFRKLLVDQVVGKVRWRESLQVMADLGVVRLLEVGAGRVLCGLARRTVPSIETLALGTVGDIVEFFASLSRK